MNHPQIYLISKSINKTVINKMMELYAGKKINIITTSEVISSINPEQWINISFINENEILNKKEIQEKLAEIGNTGWYYQQFLKYQTVSWAKEDNIHIIDGDSILRPSWSKNEIIATTGNKAHSKYTLFSKLIINQPDDQYSFVTNQMVFNKNILEKLINEIELLSNKKWIDAIIEIMKKNKDAIFSEYQLYGNYAMINSKVKIKKIKVFRRMDCINEEPNNGLKKYDLIAYEPQHKTGLIRHFRANILYRLGITLG